MTVDRTREMLMRTRLPSGGCLLEFDTTSGYHECPDHSLVMTAFDEIVAKVPLAEAGVLTFTAAEKLLFQLLSWAAQVTPPVPQHKEPNRAQTETGEAEC